MIEIKTIATRVKYAALILAGRRPAEVCWDENERVYASDAARAEAMTLAKKWRLPEERQDEIEDAIYNGIVHYTRDFTMPLFWQRMFRWDSEDIDPKDIPF